MLKTNLDNSISAIQHHWKSLSLSLSPQKVAVVPYWTREELPICQKPLDQDLFIRFFANQFKIWETLL